MRQITSDALLHRQFDAATMFNIDSSPAVPLSSHPIRRNGWIDAWPHIQQRLMGSSKILLALNVDDIGFVPAPESRETGMPADLRHLLRRLKASPRVVLAFISGRPLRNLRSQVGFRDAMYAGNHGMEVEGLGFSCKDGLASSCRSDLVDILSYLNRYARRLPGIVIEDRGLSLSVRCASAEQPERQRLRDLLDAVVPKRPRLQLTERSGTIDILGRSSWDKGQAIRHMMDYLQVGSSELIYLADAGADERTFSRLSGGHLFSLGSTPAPTASYHLSTPLELMQLLVCFLCLVNETPLA